MNELISLFEQAGHNIAEDNPILFGLTLLASMGYGVILRFIYSIYFLKNEPIDASIARSFPIIAPGVTAIFWLIQYSLPLSLGLLGALSFVRFRTPVKRAEDIAFILIVISIALACAVQKMWVGAIIILVLLIYTFIRNNLALFFRDIKQEALVTFHTNDTVKTSSVFDVATSVCGDNVHFVSSSTHDGIQSMVLQINTSDQMRLETLKGKLRDMDSNSRVDIFYPDHELGGY